MAARVKVIRVARPKPSITRGGEEVGPSIMVIDLFSSGGSDDFLQYGTMGV